MNADAIRYLYGYHFSENRLMWDRYILPLSYEPFIQDPGYSHGSARKQVLHMIEADDLWFRELQNAAPPEPFPAADLDDRPAIRAHWDAVEQNMHAYLEGLTGDMLSDRPIREPEDDRVLITWQVLLHVVNHGTDHRAQLLRLFNDMGVKTVSQDLIFYIYDHL